MGRMWHSKLETLEWHVIWLPNKPPPKYRLVLGNPPVPISSLAWPYPSMNPIQHSRLSSELSLAMSSHGIIDLLNCLFSAITIRESMFGRLAVLRPNCFKWSKPIRRTITNDDLYSLESTPPSVLAIPFQQVNFSRVQWSWRKMIRFVRFVLCWEDLQCPS